MLDKLVLSVLVNVCVYRGFTQSQQVLYPSQLQDKQLQHGAHTTLLLELTLENVKLLSASDVSQAGTHV